jgi:hypothetical protein
MKLAFRNEFACLTNDGFQRAGIQFIMQRDCQCLLAGAEFSSKFDMASPLRVDFEAKRLKN